MMRSLLIVVLIPIFGFATHAQNFAPWPNLKPDRRLSAEMASRRRAAAVHRGPSRLPSSATSEAVQVVCPADADGAACGFVAVPLNREHPSQGKIRIYFELYTHSSPGPAQSAILVNFGGPGVGTTGTRGFAQFLFAPNLDVHDLLLIDDRGRGLSGTIDCAELQHGSASFEKAIADCAAQLGKDASRYGTGDIAQDTEAVRAALGYDKVDYHGGSYGGSDVTAYATRFGEHLRSIVLDAPYGTPALDQLAFARYRTQSILRAVRLQCMRSPSCSRDHPEADAELSQLVQTIKSHPLEGDAHNSSGRLVNVFLDEELLLSSLLATPTGNFVSTGEVLAAAKSLDGGDNAPLLRLAAEGSIQFPFDSDVGDPVNFTMGGHYATGCVDPNDLWDWSAPISERKLQYDRAVSAMEPDAFEPFSKLAATGLRFSLFANRCLAWEKPVRSSPVAAAHARYPRVPTLVLTGDLDTLVPLEETAKVAVLFPESSLVTVADAGHESVLWTQCARDLASHFIETLQAGDISCAMTPEIIFPAVGRFPLLADDALAAVVSPNGNNRIGIAERKVATVAVATATDALQRVFIGSGDGTGLRGGTFHTEFADTAWTTTLKDCAYTEDVIVSGTVKWGEFNDYSLVADLSVSGRGTAGGTLHLEGTWQAAGPVGNFRVSGTLGRRNVAVLVPEA